MLRTVRFFGIMTVGVLWATALAEAQQPAKAARIGILWPAPDNQVFRRDFQGFREALREGGYVEGTNLKLEYRVRSGSPGELQGLAEELAATIGPCPCVGASRPCPRGIS